jgi:hypothetical protein
MSVITLLKLLGCKMKIFALEALAVVLLLGATGATLLQGKHGGEIVYEYGMPFKAYLMQDTLIEAANDASESEDTEEQVEILTDAINEIIDLEEE